LGSLRPRKPPAREGEARSDALFERQILNPYAFTPWRPCGAGFREGQVEQVTVNGSLSDVYSGKLAGHALTNEFDAL
jgi:hypothetical protein